MNSFEKLKQEISKGIEDLDTGRYTTYNEDSLMNLVEEVCKTGRERLNSAVQDLPPFFE